MFRFFVQTALQFLGAYFIGHPVELLLQQAVGRLEALGEGEGGN